MPKPEWACGPEIPIMWSVSRPAQACSGQRDERKRDRPNHDAAADKADFQPAAEFWISPEIHFRLPRPNFMRGLRTRRRFSGSPIV
jgi:hypothetical protein